MPAGPDLDDLALVLSVARLRSIGAAATDLGVAQPSASARLARLERRCGVRLFDRDTTGARPTAAGQEMAQHAEHILGHVAAVFDAAKAAGATPVLTIGTFTSLAAALFPALDMLLPDVRIEPRAEQGDLLMHWVAEGTMDAAFVAIADQVQRPRGVVVHRVGEDELVLLRRRDVPGIATGRSPLRDREVLFTTYDTRSADIAGRLERLGARPRRGVTTPATVAMARRRGRLAVLPRSAIANDLRLDEVIDPLPFRMRIRLSMITPRSADERLVDALPALRKELGLKVAQRTTQRSSQPAPQPTDPGQRSTSKAAASPAKAVPSTASSRR